MTFRPRVITEMAVDARKEVEDWGLVNERSNLLVCEATGEKNQVKSAVV